MAPWRRFLVLTTLASWLPTVTSNNGYYQQRYDQNYNNNDDLYNGLREFDVCDGSVVQVVSLYVVCDSPYTFYYGSGANRHSPVCNYGDKVSMNVAFQVVDDIRDDSEIYITLAVYDEYGNLLVSVDPFYLCEDLVGYDCTYAGYYTFSYKLRLPYPVDSSISSSQEGSANKFLPDIHMAFSTKADSGYNLGAMNVQCAKWNNGAETGSVSWSRKRRRPPAQQFLYDYGILLLASTILVGLGVFIYREAVKIRPIEEDTEGKDAPKGFGLMID